MSTVVQRGGGGGGGGHKEAVSDTFKNDIRMSHCGLRHDTGSPLSSTLVASCVMCVPCLFVRTSALTIMKGDPLQQ